MVPISKLLRINGVEEKATRAGVQLNARMTRFLTAKIKASTSNLRRVRERESLKMTEASLKLTGGDIGRLRKMGEDGL